MGREISEAAECVFMTHTVSDDTSSLAVRECGGLSPSLPAGHSAQPCSEVCLPGARQGLHICIPDEVG